MSHRIVHGIDADGLFIADFIIREVPVLNDNSVQTSTHDVPDDPEGMAACAQIITTHPPAGLQCPQWNGTAWVDAHMPWSRDPDTGAFNYPEESES